MDTSEVEVIEYHFRCFSELKELSRKIHHQDENACNYGLTPRQEKMLDKMLNRADDIAKSMGLRAYHQGDPRGCSLYLITEEMNDSSYNLGVAIY